MLIYHSERKKSCSCLLRFIL